jgi:hypothetical protein
MASVNNGSTITGKSSDLLDISTAATTNTLDVRIVGLYEDEANEDYSALGHQYIVRLNEGWSKDSPDGIAEPAIEKLNTNFKKGEYTK